jgi:hypothetical protein
LFCRIQQNGASRLLMPLTESFQKKRVFNSGLLYEKRGRYRAGGSLCV